MTEFQDLTVFSLTQGLNQRQPSYSATIAEARRIHFFPPNPLCGHRESRRSNVNERWL